MAVQKVRTKVQSLITYHSRLSLHINPGPFIHPFTMFKRVDRKRKKREEEEELGLDEDIKAIMGLNDTDSEESASESDSSSDGDSDAEQSGEGDLEEAGDETEDEGEDDEPPISLSEALRDPVYVVSLDPDVRACILCKGKVIKGTPMSQVHKTSIVCTFLKHETGKYEGSDCRRLINDDSSVSRSCLRNQIRTATPGRSQGLSRMRDPLRNTLIRRAACRSVPSKE